MEIVKFLWVVPNDGLLNSCLDKCDLDGGFRVNMFSFEIWMVAMELLHLIVTLQIEFSSF